MKIALMQGPVASDRPVDNLEHLKNALKREPAASAALTVLPALILSGRLDADAQARPGLDLQYRKVWQDLLKLSAEYPRTALASSHLFWAEDGSGPVEKFFLIRSGRELMLAERDQELAVDLDGLKLAFWSGEPGQENPEADLAISLRESQYQGQPFTPPSLGPARAWRLNVSAVGGEGAKIYQGATWVADPSGEIKGWASGFGSVALVFDTESKALPGLGAQPERESVAVLYEALKTGLRDFVLRQGEGRVLLGLSGGLDSALVAVLAVDALGPDRVLAVAMPSEFNAPESLSLARQQASSLGIAFLTIPITSIKEAFTRSFLLTPKASVKEGNLADENIQARIRGVLLMYLANREDRLLLSTYNKSESAMGYGTLYGDLCGAIAPIGDVYKTRAYELARYLNRQAERIPEAVISRPPSAELRPDQKDEDSLPPYEILDSILSLHLEGRLSGSRVAREGGYSSMTVAWVLSTMKKAAFKRRQAPFSLIVSSCPLGRS